MISRFAVKAVEHAQVRIISCNTSYLFELMHHFHVDLLEYTRESFSTKSSADQVCCYLGCVVALIIIILLLMNVFRLDDEIFEHAKSEFPELFENDYEKLVTLDEDWMKSASGKDRWRNFIQSCVVKWASAFLD